VRGPRRIEMIKHVGASPQCLHAIHHRRRISILCMLISSMREHPLAGFRYRSGRQSSDASCGLQIGPPVERKTSISAPEYTHAAACSTVAIIVGDDTHWPRDLCHPQ
jgi:hypothetical protein